MGGTSWSSSSTLWSEDPLKPLGQGFVKNMQIPDSTSDLENQNLGVGQGIQVILKNLGTAEFYVV